MEDNLTISAAITSWLIWQWDALVIGGTMIVFSFSALIVYMIRNIHRSFVPVAGKTVLVTGAASGIGRSTTELLTARGCYVYAVDINKNELENAFAKNPQVRMIYADVTKSRDIERIVRIVQEEKKALWGIVNSAGILRVWPRKEAMGTVELDMDEDVMPVFNVNLFAIMRLTTALMPMVMKSKGRVVNISSALGRFAVRFIGPYCASKFALEGYSDCLRRELKDVGVKVAIIEPGYTDTPFVAREKFTQIFVDPMSTAFCSSIASGLSKGMKTFCTLQKPIVVAESIFDALFSESPKARYLVDFPWRRAMYQLLYHLPDPVVDAIASVVVD